MSRKTGSLEVLTVEQVRHVASLARLSLTAAEEELYRHQLSAILEAIELLRGLDTSRVEPTSHATLATSLVRADQVQPSMPVEQALANAPETSDGCFAVPKIIE